MKKDFQNTTNDLVTNFYARKKKNIYKKISIYSPRQVSNEQPVKHRS